jgi:hypothetical protein
LIRANLMHRRRIDRLIDIEEQPTTSTNQLALQWA